MRMVKIGTDLNPADLLTKPLPFKHIRELCKLVGVEYDQSEHDNRGGAEVMTHGILGSTDPK